MDSGVTHLDASADGMAARFAAVSITLGRTTLAETPESFTSNATVLTRVTRAAFETLYAAKLAIGSTAARDPTATMRPFPAFVIPGNMARNILWAERRFTSKILSQVSSGVSATGWPPSKTP